MRTLLACACLLGCARQAAAPVRVAAEIPAPTSTVSFLERTGPRHTPRDVPHVDVTATARGLQPIVAMDRLAARCWLAEIEQAMVLVPTNYGEVVFVTL